MSATTAPLTFEPLDSAQRFQLAERLADAWLKYAALFGDVPRGTLKQLAALVELAGLGCENRPEV